MKREDLARTLLAEYARLRDDHERERETRMLKAGELDARIPQLIAGTSQLFQRQARILIEQPAEAPAKIAEARKQAANMRQEIRLRLKKLGLKEDYLDPIYRCPQCRDTGFVGEPIKTHCACFTRRLTEMMYAEANIGGMEYQNFETYDETVFPDEVPAGGRLSQRRQAVLIRNRCEQYADTFPETPKLGITMIGKSGLGKTFLLNCITKRVLDRGHSALKITAYRMLDAMRAYHFGNEEGRRNFQELVDCPLLLLDDLGTEPLLQNITLEYLFTLLNERLSARRHTIIATNLNQIEIRERYGERIMSRMLDTMNVDAFELMGCDIRLTKNGGTHK